MQSSTGWTSWDRKTRQWLGAPVPRAFVLALALVCVLFILLVSVQFVSLYNRDLRNVGDISSVANSDLLELAEICQ